MHAPIQLILLVFAFVCFFIAAAWRDDSPRIRLIGAGLAFLAASQFASGVTL